MENFETVLRSVSDAITIGEALGKKRPLERRRHRSIREALAHAVQGVHVTGGEIPESTFTQIREELRRHRRVFSTSYDLILYWAAAKGEPSFDGFFDYFWARNCNAFDESTIRFSDSHPYTRLYFLHGALHLVATSGLTAKRTATLMEGLLEQFGEPYKGDATARPVIITEGSAAEKKHSIDANDYLTFCWKELRRCEAPLVIFGHSLSGQDSHLISALNEHEKRPLAISLRDHGRTKNRREQYRIRSLLDSEQIYFYNSETHPLGDKDLALGETPWRRLLSLGKKRKASAVA